MTESNSVRLARLEEKFDGVIRSQDQLSKLLKGNGKPGYIEESEKRFTAIELKIAEFNGGKKLLTAMFGSSLITGILIFILGKFYS